MSQQEKETTMDLNSGREKLRTETEEKIRKNNETFRRLVRRAETEEQAGQYARSAESLQQAASFAWFNHPGLFSDNLMENLLWRLAERLPAMPQTPRQLEHRQIVLHVVTQLYATGGHTQMLARWIKEDPLSEHRVLAVRQGSTPYPGKVTQLLGTSPYSLDRLAGTIPDRARLLRLEAAESDLVVVHAHPDDLVPAVALAGQRTPVIYVNHADHVFWAGSSTADLVIHLRHSGAELSASRRAVQAARSVMMNRPLAVAESVHQRSVERAALHVAADQVLLVSAASANKYEPIGPHSLLEMLEESIRRNPGLVVRVAGPAPSGPWADAERRSHGRLKALGSLPSVQGIFCAADIYVDSFPFSSLTSLLEAGSHQLPVVSFRGHAEQCAVLGADSPDVDTAISYPSTKPEFQEIIRKLTEDESGRTLAGARLAELISGSHEQSWTKQLELVYARAHRSRATRPQAKPTKCESGALDAAVGALQERTGFALGAVGASRATLGVMPPMRRVGTWARLRRAGLTPRLLELCSDRWRIRLEELALRVRAVPRIISGRYDAA